MSRHFNKAFKSQPHGDATGRVRKWAKSLEGNLEALWISWQSIAKSQISASWHYRGKVRCPKKICRIHPVGNMNICTKCYRILLRYLSPDQSGGLTDISIPKEVKKKKKKALINKNRRLRKSNRGVNLFPEQTNMQHYPTYRDIIAVLGKACFEFSWAETE